MKKESNVAYILRLALTLLIICAVVAGLLSGVNAITKHRINAIQEQKIHEALQLVLPGVIGLRKMELSGETGIVSAVYYYGKNYAVEVNPIGFDGPVKMMVGVVGGKVTGISIISHTETPGLGAVAAEKSAKGAGFRVQFIGLVSGIEVNGEGENSIDSITGATITSKAVTAGVNAALEFVANLNKGA